MIQPVIHRFDEAGSTNDIAAELAREGAPEGTVVTALLQSKGRGRRGRQWHALPGESALVSVVLRPTLPLNQFHQLAFVAAVAVGSCLEECGVRSELKWPNDVLVDDKKICGILVETAGSAAVVGIGINVKQTDFPLGLNAQATSVALCGGNCLDVDAVVDMLLRHLFSVYSQPFEEILGRWRKYMWGVGRRVKIVTEGETVSGKISGVDSYCALLLDDGQRRIVSAETINVLRT